MIDTAAVMRLHQQTRDQGRVPACEWGERPPTPEVHFTPGCVACTIAFDAAVRNGRIGTHVQMFPPGEEPVWIDTREAVAGMARNLGIDRLTTVLTR